MLRAGANPNIVSSDKVYYEEYVNLSLDETNPEKDDGYYTILNELYNWDHSDEYYQLIIPYCKPLLFNYALRWKKGKKRKYMLPGAIIKQIKKLVE